MSFKIDPKLVALASIILGLFLGFYVNNTLLSRPRIETLTNQTIQQQIVIDKLEDQEDLFHTEFDALEALNTQLEENSVPLITYEALQGEADALGDEVTALERYLDSGGFLWVDDFWGQAEWNNFARNVGSLRPGWKWRPEAGCRRWTSWPPPPPR